MPDSVGGRNEAVGEVTGDGRRVNGLIGPHQGKRLDTGRKIQPGFGGSIEERFLAHEVPHQQETLAPGIPHTAMANIPRSLGINASSQAW